MNRQEWSSAIVNGHAYQAHSHGDHTGGGCCLITLSRFGQVSEIFKSTLASMSLEEAIEVLWRAGGQSSKSWQTSKLELQNFFYPPPFGNIANTLPIVACRLVVLQRDSHRSAKLDIAILPYPPQAPRNGTLTNGHVWPRGPARRHANDGARRYSSFFPSHNGSD